MTPPYPICTALLASCLSNTGLAQERRREGEREGGKERLKEKQDINKPSQSDAGTGKQMGDTCKEKQPIGMCHALGPLREQQVS